MSGPVILSLDLATRFGWCVGELDSGQPDFGAGHFAPEGSGDDAIFGGAFKWTAEIIQQRKVNRVRIEQPLDPRHLGKMTNRRTFERLYGIPAAVRAACYLCRVYDIEYVPASKVRASLGLKGVKKDQWKERVMWAVQARGFDCHDNDAADALAIWLHACEVSRT